MIQRISISGYRSIKGKVHYDYSPGCSVIVGPNGTGKTTLAADAAFWALFGESLRQNSKSAAVVNRDSTMATVQVMLQVAGIGQVLITRTRTSKGKQTFTATNEQGEGVIPSQANAGAAKLGPVEALLGMDKETVRRVSFYSPSTGFMGATPTQRSETMDLVLGLGWLEEARTKATAKAKDLAAEVARAQLNRASRTTAAEERERMATTLQQSVGQAKAQAAAQAQEDTSKLQAQRSVVFGRLTSVESNLAALNEALAQLNQGHTQIQERMAFVQAQAREIEKALHQQLTKKARLETKAAAVAEEMARVGSIEGACPTCGQTFSATARNDLLASLRDTEAVYTAQLREADAVANTVAQSLQTINSSLTDPSADLPAARAQLEVALRDTGQQAAALGREAAGLQSEIAGLDNQITALGQAAASGAQAHIQQLQSRATQAQADAATARTQADAATAALAKAEQEAAQAEWWKVALGPKGIRSYMVEAVLPALSGAANRYLRWMTDGKLGVTISPTYTTTTGEVREGITPEVQNLAGLDSYAESSTGEQRMVDVALTLALSDVAKSFGARGLGLVVLDEGLDAVDSSNACRAVELLSSLGSTEGLSVQILTHSVSVRAAEMARYVQASRGPDGWSAYQITDLGHRVVPASVGTGDTLPAVVEVEEPPAQPAPVVVAAEEDPLDQPPAPAPAPAPPSPREVTVERVDLNARLRELYVHAQELPHPAFSLIEGVAKLSDEAAVAEEVRLTRKLEMLAAANPRLAFSTPSPEQPAPKQKRRSRSKKAAPEIELPVAPEAPVASEVAPPVPPAEEPEHTPSPEQPALPAAVEGPPSTHEAQGCDFCRPARYKAAMAPTWHINPWYPCPRCGVSMPFKDKTTPIGPDDLAGEGEATLGEIDQARKGLASTIQRLQVAAGLRAAERVRLVQRVNPAKRTPSRLTVEELAAYLELLTSLYPDAASAAAAQGGAA